METLEKAGDLKGAAGDAILIVQAFGMEHLLLGRAIQAAFDGISKEEFYEYCIKCANLYCKEIGGR
jgi:hypothetical protein